MTSMAIWHTRGYNEASLSIRTTHTTRVTGMGWTRLDHMAQVFGRIKV